MMNQMFEFTPQQEKAIQHLKGPLLLVAGPGTGKTRVITEKIRYLLQEKKVSPKNILALTFTEKAAQEMLARIDEVMPLGYEEPWLSTFHSFCDRILRESGVEIGLDPSYKIMTPPQAWIFVKEHLYEFDFKYFRPLGNPTKFLQDLLTLFSRAADEDVAPNEYFRWASSKLKVKSSKLRGEEKEEAEKQMEIARAYETYSALKTLHSKLDFADLISLTLRLFRERKSVLNDYQRQFEYIFVDEFQDTNFAQYQLLKLLAPPKESPNIMVVADDDQCIYKWRGASISNVWQFKKDYPKAKTLVLDETFRLTNQTFAPSYQLIQNNNPDRLEPKLGISKQLACRRQGPKPQLLVAETGDEEAEKVVEKIEELRERGGYSFSDFAILARANNHLDPFIAALRRHGLPYQIVGGRGLFEQEEVKYLLSVLRVLADPNDKLSWYQIFSFEERVPQEEALAILSKAQKESRPVWEVLVPPEETNPSGLGLPTRRVEESADLAPVKIIQDLHKAALKKPPTVLLYEFIKKSKLIENLTKNESVENNLKIKNINLFFEHLKSFETESKSPNVLEVVAFLGALIEAGESPAQAEIEDIDTVALLTIHAAKGLEFANVFLVNLVNDRFPTRPRRDPLELPLPLFKELLPEGDAHLEEERRLFYVGATRARDNLILSLAHHYGNLSRAARAKKPSPFIYEFGFTIDEIPVKVGGLPAEGGVWQAEEKEVHAKEKAYQIRRLSYSHLDDFKTCPLRFKYRHILQIPVPPNRAQSFGQSLHRTLRDFHRGADQSRARLLELLKTHWIPLGYDSPQDMQNAYEEGEKILKTYHKTYQKIFGEPLHLEKKFAFKVGGYPLVGFIDRIDKVEEGFEIIDYKTSDKLPTQKEVDQDDQLTIYAIAAEHALEIKPKNLSLFFLKQGEKITTQRTKEQLEEKKKEIEALIKQIETSDFAATPGYHCHFCDFKTICPAFKLAPPLR